MAATEHVILVDDHDQPIGEAEKIYAHREGLCHRAFSVFVLRQVSQYEVLLQQRAKGKYHSPGLWTNSCCSHPRPEEDTVRAAQRRLYEELGLNIALKSIGSFHYIAHFQNGLIENEIDHVLVGDIGDANITHNPQEIQAYRWMALEDLKNEIVAYPEKYTPWLDLALAIVLDWTRESEGEGEGEGELKHLVNIR